MDALEQIAATVLYEGYVLWPYRRSARKNQQRWTFGGVYPRGFCDAARNGDAWRVQTQCLVVGAAPVVEVELRFLQVVERRVARVLSGGSLQFVDKLEVDGQPTVAWDEALEHCLVVPAPVTISAGEQREELDGGVIVRSWHDLNGHVEVTSERLGDDLSRVTASLANTSDWSGLDRTAAQRHGFMSAHFVLRARDGTFVSLTDPPPHLAAEAASCENVGLWPVLVENAQTMLASPIILYDFPKIAPESPGLLFDSGEIDQLLILNTLTLTDAEKAEVRATDPRARELLDRVESLSPDVLSSLHGAIRDFQVLRPAPAGVVVDGVELREGATIRLRPRSRADAFDLLLDGKLGTIQAIEQDFDDRVHLAVILADDPGRDLGMERMPGHRFFFSPEEVEPVL